MYYTESPHLFQLLNKEILLFDKKKLRFATGWEPGNSKTWFKTHLNYQILNAIDFEKKYKPKFASFTQGNEYQIVIADFDKHDGFASQVVQRKYLKKTYKKIAFVRTSSGNTKAFIQVKISDPNISEGDFVEHARDFIETMFYNDKMDSLDNIDLSYSAIASSFINKPTLGVLNNINNYSIFDLDTDKNTSNISFLNTLVSMPSKLYQLYAGEIGNKQLDQVLNSKLKENFTRVLLSTKGLLTTKGFQFSQRKIAEALNCSLGMANLLIQMFKSLGFLKCIDHSYIVDVRAKTYVATGLLLSMLQAIYPKISSQNTNLPIRIEDGQYQEVIWRLSYYWWQYPDVFIDWIKEIVPDDKKKKGRISKVTQAIKSRARYCLINKRV